MMVLSGVSRRKQIVAPDDDDEEELQEEIVEEEGSLTILYFESLTLPYLI